MNIQPHVTGFIEENCYLVTHPQTRQTVIIDPGDDAALLLRHISDTHSVIVAYLLTHGHVDHLTALADLTHAHPAPVYLHPLDAEWCFTPENSIPGMYPPPRRPSSPIHPVTDNQRLDLAGAQWTVIETPGHTPGGVCYKLEPDIALFTGDTLFRGSAGRTDLPGGNFPTLNRSLQKLATLPDALPVYSGHGPATTIGHEKQTNYFLQ